MQHTSFGLSKVINAHAATCRFFCSEQVKQLCSLPHIVYIRHPMCKQSNGQVPLEERPSLHRKEPPHNPLTRPKQQPALLGPCARCHQAQAQHEQGNRPRKEVSFDRQGNAVNHRWSPGTCSHRKYGILVENWMGCSGMYRCPQS